MEYGHELRVSEFFIEGRDESRSQIIIHINEPEPEEASHGYFVALTELQNATPKTVQMAEAWVAHVSDYYYKHASANAGSRFEEMLERFNTQSTLYARQHTNEHLHILIASIVGTDVRIAAHGSSRAIMFYHKTDGWHHVDIAHDQADSVDSVPMFSQVIEGSLRPNDRLLLATPHVFDYFSADRIEKISEGKTAQEVSAHMKRVLTELESDFSFGAVWLNTQLKLLEEKPRPQTASTRRAAVTLAPQVLPRTNAIIDIVKPIKKIQRDKIVTTLLITTRAAAIICGRCTIIALKKTKTASENIYKKWQESSAAAGIRSWPRLALQWFHSLPTVRQKWLMIAATGITATLIGIAVLWGVRASQSRSAARTVAYAKIQSTISESSNAFLFQNEPLARVLLTQAEQSFIALPIAARDASEGKHLNDTLVSLRDTIWRRTRPVFTEIAASAPFESIIFVEGKIIGITSAHDIGVASDTGAQPLGVLRDARALVFDEEKKRLLALHGDKTISGVSVSKKAITEIPVSWHPEQTDVGAILVYGSRLYSYDPRQTMIFRYDTEKDGFGKGKKWITDNVKPTNVAALSSDGALWMLTQNDAVLKFLNGRMASFHFNNIEPSIETVDGLWTRANASAVYFLDRKHRRIVATDGSGEMLKQFLFPNSENLKSFTIEQKETTAFGITDNGRLVKFLLK